VKQLRNVINKRAKEEVLMITLGMELEVVTTSIVEKRRDSTMMEGKRWMLMTTTSGECRRSHRLSSTKRIRRCGDRLTSQSHRTPHLNPTSASDLRF
jgi:hypothetical protein